MKDKKKQLIGLGAIIAIICVVLTLTNSLTASHVESESSSTNTTSSKKDATTDSISDSGKSSDTDTSKATKEKSDNAIVSNSENSTDSTENKENSNTDTPKAKDGEKTWVPPEYKTVAHPEEGHYEKTETSAAWTEYYDVFICYCGLEFPSHAAWKAHSDAVGG